MTIIAVYAAQMDYQNCEADVKRIEAPLEHYQLFVARKKESFSLIYKFVNELELSKIRHNLEFHSASLSAI